MLQSFPHSLDGMILLKNSKVSRILGRLFWRFSFSVMGMELAELWEADALLRNRARRNDRLTEWPTPQTIGVASMRACAQNAQALMLLATWWVERSDRPSAIPIKLVRTQVSGAIAWWSLLGYTMLKPYRIRYFKIKFKYNISERAIR